MSASKRKGNTRQDKDKASKKKRGKLDTNSDAKYNAAEKRRYNFHTKEVDEYND
jgi:hypothetical protein